MIKKFICTKNKSIAMEFTPGREYSAVMVEPELFRIEDDLGNVELMPITGNLVTFSEVKQ